MISENLPGWPTVSRLGTFLLIGALSILGLAVCTQTPPLDPTDVPEVETAASTLTPEAAVPTASPPVPMGTCTTCLWLAVV